jgi:signal transduction histidine kinase
MGLNAMRQRAAALGAELRVESSAGRGARVLLWVPG